MGGGDKATIKKMNREKFSLQNVELFRAIWIPRNHRSQPKMMVVISTQQIEEKP